MQILYLVRHAEPEGDHPLRYLGRTDPGLGASGREQALTLSEWLGNEAGLAVVSSPARRARETAELAFAGRAPILEPLAVEMSYGCLDGLLPAAAQRLYPEAAALHRRHPAELGAIGGEDWVQVQARARELATKLERIGSCVLISHQGFITALLQVLPSNDQALRYVPPLGYARGIPLQRDGEGRWSLRR